MNERERKNEYIKKMINDSGKTLYHLNKYDGIAMRTVENWYYNRSEAITSLLKLIVACSKNDKEIAKHVKELSKEKKD